MHEILSVTLRCDCWAPMLARNAVRASGAFDSVLEDAVLLASELVSSLVDDRRCSPLSELELVAEPTDRGIRIIATSADPETALPTSQERCLPGLDERLAIVQALATDWGIERDSRLCFWAELAV